MGYVKRNHTTNILIIWGPNLCDSKWSELQTAQNSVLRTAFHPVKEHCQMLSKQFLLTTQDSHPNNINHINYNPARLMKYTLTSQHDNYIRPLIQPKNPQHYKFLLKLIHTISVSAYIQLQDNNPVLD